MGRWTATPRLAVAFAWLALLAGCSAGATVSPQPTPALGDPSSSPTTTPPVSPASLATLQPLPPGPTTSPAPKPTGSFVGQVVITLADEGLRIRSQPRISDDSYKASPLLPLGTKLYVLDGPVSASGYAWYEVVPLTSRTLPSGWVASAGRDGVQWIAASTFDCPPVPTDLRSLAALPPGVGLACFSRVPITVEARLVDCNCDPGPWGGGIDPAWMWSEGGGTLLVDPSETRPPDHALAWFELLLDPTAEQPDVLPVARYEGGTSWSRVPIVVLTGMFDHPAAAACTYTSWQDGSAGTPVRSQLCRLEFAVTRLVLQRP